MDSSLGSNRSLAIIKQTPPDNTNKYTNKCKILHSSSVKGLNLPPSYSLTSNYDVFW